MNPWSAKVAAISLKRKFKWVDKRENANTINKMMNNRNEMERHTAHFQVGYIFNEV